MFFSLLIFECEKAFKIVNYFSREPRSLMSMETTNDLLAVHSPFKYEEIIVLFTDI